MPMSDPELQLSELPGRDSYQGSLSDLLGLQAPYSEVPGDQVEVTPDRGSTLTLVGAEPVRLGIEYLGVGAECCSHRESLSAPFPVIAAKEKTYAAGLEGAFRA